MMVLSGLMRLSAGRRGTIGRLAVLALLLSLLQIILLWWSPGAWLEAWGLNSARFVDIGPYADRDLVNLLPKLGLLAIASFTALRAKRQDTRLIALLLAGAAIFPFALDFCNFEGGFNCRP
jgi:hypothetical protein